MSGLGYGVERRREGVRLLLDQFSLSKGVVCRRLTIEVKLRLPCFSAAI